MRLWSLHPVYLDARGLVALWRESLLAQQVLRGRTRGYRNHPQLARFKQTRDPLAAIAGYLGPVAAEAQKRGYRFDKNKIIAEPFRGQIPVASGQIDYEFAHLLDKLKRRSPERYRDLHTVVSIRPHPLMRVHPGGVEPWEIIGGN